MIINGPNLNLLGRREPQIYGHQSMDDYLSLLGEKMSDVMLEYFQSNHEGDIIDKLHAIGFDHTYTGIVLNAGAYTHTSLAIADAIAAIELPVVEVHISNVAARKEAVRHQSMIAPVCSGSIVGFGMKSYQLAIEALL